MAANGLLRAVPNDELMRQERQRNQQALEGNRLAETETALSAHIRKSWERAKRNRQDVTDRLLECLRQRNGEYDPATLRDIREQGGSEIYMMITATKCRAAKAWLKDVMLPAGDRAWGLEPTPIPDIPPEIERAVFQKAARDVEKSQAQAQEQQGGAQGNQQAMQQQDQQPVQQNRPEESQIPMQEMEPQAAFDARVEELREKLKRKTEEYAKDAAERMERKIEDQLAEGNWDTELDQFLEDFITFPYAILKGPVLRRRRTFQWAEGFRVIPVDELRLEFVRVSPFDIYWSQSSTDPQEGELIEHERYTRKQLYDLIGMPGYNDEAIRAALDDYGRGGLREWVWNEDERERAEGRNTTWDREAHLIDGLHFWGPAQGLMLLEWGIDPDMIEDPLAEYEVDAILVGRHVIRAEVNEDPLQRRPYHKACWQNKPGAFAGIALPELMADIQSACNATARALVNNMGISSGPQVVILTDLLAAGEDVTSLFPWQIHQMTSDEMGSAQQKPVQFYQPQSNAKELMGVFEEFERRADEATNIPRYAYGSQEVGGAAKTASGLSMLLNSTAKGIREAVSHVDLGVIRSAISMTWFHNMLYAEDDAIKGDVKVQPRGASVLVAKDTANARRSEFLGMTANEYDMAILGMEGRAEILRDLARDMDLPEDLIPPREEVKRREQQQARQPSPEMLKEQREREAMEREDERKRQELAQKREEHYDEMAKEYDKLALKHESAQPEAASAAYEDET